MSFIEKMLGIRNDAAKPETEPAATEENQTVPEAGSAAEQADPAADPAQQDNQQPKTFTPEELDRFVKEKRREWEAEQKAAEQERLQRLPEGERLKREQMDQQDRIAQLEAELARRDLKQKVMHRLEELRLPPSIEEILPYTGDEETTMKNLDTFAEAVHGAVLTAVKERLRGKTPAGFGDGYNRTQAMLNSLYGGREAAQGDAFANALRKE